MGKNFRETLNEQLKDPIFKKEWDALDRLPEDWEFVRKLEEAEAEAETERTDARFSSEDVLGAIRSEIEKVKEAP